MQKLSILSTIKLSGLSIIIAFVIGLSSCSKTHLEPYNMRIMAFGTWVDISLYVDGTVDKEQLQQQLESSLQSMHKKWHAWRPGELSRINQAFAKGQSINVDPQMRGLLQLSQRLEKASQGLFNPAIGQLLKLWGFQRDDPFNVNALPSQQDIDRLLENPASTIHIQFNEEEISSTNSLVAMDFGGFGKGFGIDLLIEQLKAQGIEHALINAGGDLRAIGKAGNRFWRIGIRDPFDDSTLATLQLRQDTSVFTSGNYERGYVIDGKKYHHIINPISGYPAQGIASATVIGVNGVWSDAAATAMLLAGTDKAFEIARNMGVQHLLLITDDGQLHLDAAMLKLLEFTRPQEGKLHFHKFTEPGSNLESKLTGTKHGSNS